MKKEKENHTRKFRRQFDWKLSKSDLEKTDPVSATIEGEAFTIRELLDRYTSGGYIPNLGEGEYFDGDPDFEDLDVYRSEGSDIADVIQEKQLLDNKIQQAKNTMSKRQSKTKQPSDTTGEKSSENLESETQ